MCVCVLCVRNDFLRSPKLINEKHNNDFRHVLQKEREGDGGEESIKEKEGKYKLEGGSRGEFFPTMPHASLAPLWPPYMLLNTRLFVSTVS